MRKALTKGSLERRGGLWCMNSGKGRNHKKCFPKPDDLCLDGTLKRRETGTLQTAEWVCPHGCAYGACRTRACSANFIFVVLENGQTEDRFPSDEGRELCYFLCVVFTFLLATIQWLVKEILIFWSIGYEYLMDDDSIKVMPRMMDGCWILNTFRRRKVKLCQNDGNTAVLTVIVWAVLSFVFPAPPWLCSS